MKTATMVVAVLAAGVLLARAQENGSDRSEALDALQQRVAALVQLRDMLAERGGDAEKRRLAAVEQEIGKLERAADDLRDGLEARLAFDELQRQARSALEQVEAELAEPRPGQEIPAVYAALRDARMAYLQGRGGILQKIAALAGPEELAAALAAQDELALADSKWWLLTEPRLRGEADLWEMRRDAAERGNPPELAAAVTLAVQLHVRLLADSQRLYDLQVAHADSERKLAEAIGGYWRKVDEAEAPGE